MIIWNLGDCCLTFSVSIRRPTIELVKNTVLELNQCFKLCSEDLHKPHRHVLCKSNVAVFGLCEGGADLVILSHLRHCLVPVISAVCARDFALYCTIDTVHYTVVHNGCGIFKGIEATNIRWVGLAAIYLPPSVFSRVRPLLVV
jgi:hypothetical protein